MVRSCGITFGNEQGEVMKTLLGALAVTMLLGAATAVPAQAACWDTPWGLRCSHHYWGYGGYGYGYHHYWHPWRDYW
jgi:hypothetical protein